MMRWILSKRGTHVRGIGLKGRVTPQAVLMLLDAGQYGKDERGLGNEASNHPFDDVGFLFGKRQLHVLFCNQFADVAYMINGGLLVLLDNICLGLGHASFPQCIAEGNWVSRLLGHGYLQMPGSLLEDGCRQHDKGYNHDYSAKQRSVKRLCETKFQLCQGCLQPGYGNGFIWICHGYLTNRT